MSIEQISKNMQMNTVPPFLLAFLGWFRNVGLFFLCLHIEFLFIKFMYQRKLIFLPDFLTQQYNFDNAGAWCFVYQFFFCALYFIGLFCTVYYFNLNFNESFKVPQAVCVWHVAFEGRQPKVIRFTVYYSLVYFTGLVFVHYQSYILYNNI